MQASTFQDEKNGLVQVNCLLWRIHTVRKRVYRPADNNLVQVEWSPRPDINLLEQNQRKATNNTAYKFGTVLNWAGSRRLGEVKIWDHASNKHRSAHKNLVVLTRGFRSGKGRNFDILFRLRKTQRRSYMCFVSITKNERMYRRCRRRSIIWNSGQE